MALTATQEWYCRKNGSDTNGGGFDPGVSGAGTNYADQDSPQLTITDLACSGATATVTSATGGLTAAMIGNILRLSSNGAGWQHGYYCITGHTDTNTITLDRSPASTSATGGNAKVGGAFASWTGTLANSGPTITSPLAAGHTIKLHANQGLDNPTVADFTTTGYKQFINGDSTSGRIKWVGYGGRPLLKVNGLTWYQASYHVFENLEIEATGTSNGSLGIINISSSSNDGVIQNVRFEQNGNDLIAAVCNRVIRCEFLNSGSTTSGSYEAVSISNYGGTVEFCLFVDWRGPILDGESLMGFRNNDVIRCRNSTQALAFGSFSTAYLANVTDNIFHDCSGDAIKATNGPSQRDILIRRNIFTKNGGYGINFTGTTAVNDKLQQQSDFNIFGAGTFANTSGARNNVSAGDNDTTLTADADPYDDEANDDLHISSSSGGGQTIRDIECEIGTYVA